MAKWFVQYQDWQKLAPNVNALNPRWREVFLLTTANVAMQMICLRQMKQAVDGLMAGDEKLQQFLTWLDEKARSVDVPYKPAATRTFLFRNRPTRPRPYYLSSPFSALVVDRDRPQPRKCSRPRPRRLSRP